MVKKINNGSGRIQLVNKTLFEALPYPTYETDDIDLKTNLVFQHLTDQYYGGGMSVYGAF
jgi:type I restriction enzyme R subunit